MIRIHHLSGMFAAMMLSLAFMGSAHAAADLLTVKDFARHPPITEPSISPDGKHLAVSVRHDNDRYQLAVLELPGLKPVSRLNMAPQTPPVNINWLSNSRLVMAVARETGSLNAP